MPQRSVQLIQLRRRSAPESARDSARAASDVDGDSAAREMLSAGAFIRQLQDGGIDAEPTRDLGDYLAILRRRKWQMLIPAAVLFALAVLTAIALPSIYRSTATILIEEQEIPADLVRSTITSFADQRIQSITQRVMTRANLWQLVEKYNLYPKVRAQESSEAILDRMRKNIKLDLVSSDTLDKRSGAKNAATIAFTLSFDGNTPEQAQRVANELVSLYLNENLRSRQQMVADTSSFLWEEAKKRGERIAELEERLASFKEKNIGALPELQQANLQLRDRNEVELMDTERQIRSLEERQFYLEGQLAQTKPNTPIISARGEHIPDSEERLKMLQAQYASASALYTPEHPDVVMMRREIAALEQKTGGVSGTLAQAEQLATMRAELTALREKFSDDHPDVVRLRRSISAMEASVAKAKPESRVHARNPENPAYIALKSQQEANNADLRSLRTRRAELQSRRTQFEERIAQAPQVEREYMEIMRERENEVRQYQDIQGKRAEAQVAQELERDRKGERFSLIDPPQLPENPDRPNRKAIMLLGFILALGGGVGYGAVLESLDHSVRGPNGLAEVLDAPLLAAIPYIDNAADRELKKQHNNMVLGLSISAVILLILVVHVAVIPLDVLWIVVLRKLGL